MHPQLYFADAVTMFGAPDGKTAMVTAFRLELRQIVIVGIRRCFGRAILRLSAESMAPGLPDWP